VCREDNILKGKDLISFINSSILLVSVEMENKRYFWSEEGWWLVRKDGLAWVRTLQAADR
jgi:hypothetical protein